MTRNKIICLLMLTAAVTSSCNVINPQEDIPAYIEVDSIYVYTDMETQGTASSNLPDFWLTVDGIFLSGYPRGTKAPVLYGGKHKVELKAGIYLNGIEGMRAFYGVFDPFDTIIDLQPGAIHKIIPRVTYYAGAHFPLLEDFDHSSFQLTTPVTSAELLRESNSFQNQGGIVVMDAAHPTFECHTTDSFDLPGGTIPTYVEINHKCNTEFSVSVKAITTLGPLDYELLVVRSSDTWKKIYVNLTSIALQAQHATDWKIYIKSALAPGAITDTLRFDNIKLVY